MSYENARYEAPRVGSTTWHKGERCTVVSTDEESFAQPMTAVVFADGRVGIFRASELGLNASDVPRYLSGR